MTGPRRRAIIESDDVQNGINIGRAPDELRDAEIELEDIDIIPAHQMVSAAAEAKFMEELVTVEIEADDDPNSPVFISAGHNGITQYIKRGCEQVIKRKYLYSLLAAKRVKFACAFGKDGNGNEFNRMSGSGQSSHRVRLVDDQNPRGGMKWFQSVAASA